MGKATGVFLILAGIGTAALLLPAVDTDAQRQLADVVHNATSADQQMVTQPARPVYGAAIPNFGRSIATGTVKARTSTVQKRAERQVVAVATIETGRAPVLIAPPQAVVRNTVVAHQTDAQARQVLARDIQRELKRVGCYDGDLSGEWNAHTRQAMKAFIDHVNAALPVDEPDHILRTMVAGHPGHACGPSCPAGQTAMQQGRCRPTGLVTQNTPAHVAEARRHVVPPAMKERDIASMRPAVPRPAWETTVAAAAPAPVQPLSLEGRMAMGGPLATTPNVSGHSPASVDLTPSRAASGHQTGAFVSGGLSGMIVPGAIAALGGATSRTPLTRAYPADTGPGSWSVVTGATEGAALNSGSGVSTIESSGEQQALAGQALPHERPRVHVYRGPPPQKFKFPEPSFIGRSPKYVTWNKKSGSPFSRMFNKDFLMGR